MAKIIIVEDDPMISEIYQKKFSESGFEVMAADSGEKVLSVVKTEKVDVVLLDLILPKMNGFDVIKGIRSGGNRDVKIIVFSNLNQEEDRAKATELGANGFIMKSEHTPTNLVKEVEKMISQLDEKKKNEEKMNGNGSKQETNGKKKILLIEDEQVFLDMFGEKLRQDGFEVMCADNGAWGMKEALKGNYDLFIIDMVMPAMTGEEIIAKLKLEDSTKNIPIIVFSASVDDEMRKKVMEMGANEFFVKTQIIPSELSNKVAELLK